MPRPIRSIEIYLPLNYNERFKDRLKHKFDQLELLVTVQDLLAI